jgi:hypothetical protein
MEKISWTDRVRNEEVLRSQGGEEYHTHTVRRRNVNWVGHIERMNCLLKYFTEEKMK